MTEKVLFITDTFENLNFKKDTSILMIEEALKKEMNVFQCEINDLFVDNNDVLVNCIEINSLNEDIDTEVKKIDIDLKDFKYCFMRKDPPVDEDYNNALHLLELQNFFSNYQEVFLQVFPVMMHLLLFLYFQILEIYLNLRNLHLLLK